MAKKILHDLRQSVPMVAPFELRKRVILQAAWASGCSIFAYTPPSNADEKNKREVIEVYRELARFVMEQAEGGGVRG
jgi:hypothetical protein